MRSCIHLLGLILLAISLSGCSSPQVRSSYSVDSHGALAISCPVATVAETVLSTNASFTKSRLIFASEHGDVTSYLAAPDRPLATAVYVPGAGETPAAHDERMAQYADAGYAFLYMDVRGNGGETAGLPFGQELIQSDYEKFEAGDWPQYYLIVCDIVSARQYLTKRYRVPVYAVGSSNGGRYAAIAAAVDPSFAGYIGISTSDWGIAESVAAQGLTGDPARFAASLEPSTTIGSISPRPVWIYHSRADTIIPFSNGHALFDRAGDPKTFREFAGAHGINTDVDSKVLTDWAQIYGTRG